VLSFFATSFAHAARPVRHRAVRVRLSPHRTRRQARTAQLLAGLVAVGTGVGLLIRADLGVASWDVLHVALATRTGLSVGTASLAVSVLAVALAALLGERPRLGSLVPVVVVAPTIDLVLRLVETPADPAGRSTMLVAGVLALAAGVGAYVASDHGAGPGDLVFLGVVGRGVPIGLARFVVDGTVAAFGWWLGGPVGLGTLVITGCLGPLVAATIHLFDLAPARGEVATRDRAFHREVALELHRELEGV
jgi:uncharacterized membrane protein YczE